MIEQTNEPSNKAVRSLYAIGRAIDILLTVIGVSIQFVLIFVVAIYVLAAAEYLTYAVSLLGLVVGLVILVFALLFQGWKRL
jgi:hypothetical protein